MRPTKMPDETRAMGAPADWNDENGPCETLSIADTAIGGANYMVSAWLPTPEEILSLQNGAAIFLGIRGDRHPVVFLQVSETALAHADVPLPDGSHPLCRRCHRGEIDGLTDGSWVSLEMVSGGAHKNGYYGELSLAFHKPSDPIFVRHYIDQSLVPNLSDELKTQAP